MSASKPIQPVPFEAAECKAMRELGPGCGAMLPSTLRVTRPLNESLDGGIETSSAASKRRAGLPTCAPSTFLIDAREPPHQPRRDFAISCP